LIVAADGDDGLRRAVNQPPDLILAEAKAALSNGRFLVEQLRTLPETSGLPLVLLTSRGDPDSAAKALRAGGDDTLDRPFSAEELIARVDLHLRLRQATVRALETERLATLGLLSCGFAHDARDPLNAVINALRPLAEQIRAQETGLALDLVKIAQSSAVRVGRLCEMFLSLGRCSAGPGDVDLADTLDVALSLLHPRIPREVAVERRYSFKGRVVGMAGPLAQVWINLIDNAVRAVGQVGRVRLSVERSGNEALITVADSGSGITPEHLERLFQPFFTTRADGTGLGLALCHRIVLQHRGRIEVRSEPGTGTQFIVALPLGSLPNSSGVASGATA
jgi:signal transduction histidine kinase